MADSEEEIYKQLVAEVLSGDDEEDLLTDEAIAWDDRDMEMRRLAIQEAEEMENDLRLEEERLRTLDRLYDATIYEGNYVAMGFSHTVALTKNGEVYTWGSNYAGQLGRPTEMGEDLVPRRVIGLNHVVSVTAAESYHTVALTEEGNLYAWGSGEMGQLGNGNNRDEVYPQRVDALNAEVKAIAAGNNHTLAVLHNGHVYAWGDNYSGYLGFRSPTRVQNQPRRVERLTHVKMVAAGNAFSMALTENGDLYTWGSGTYGRLGHGTEQPEFLPRHVVELRGVISVACGSNHALAVTEEGLLYAWGNEHHGKLGLGFTIGDFQPRPQRVVDNISAVAAGVNHSVALARDGSVYTWGSGANGQLGHNSFENEYHPRLVEDLHRSGNAVAIAAGGYSTAVILEDGYVYEMGRYPFPHRIDGFNLYD